jgi:hypothetical protein
MKVWNKDGMEYNISKRVRLKTKSSQVFLETLVRRMTLVLKGFKDVSNVDVSKGYSTTFSQGIGLDSGLGEPSYVL